jgi:hypothetical protein
LVAVGMTAVVSAAGAQVASAAEGPTPQAVDAHAEFLAYAPPPPVPAKVCVVDTGVDLTTDAAPAVVERHSVYGGTTDDVGGSGLAKHGTLVAGVIASQLDGRDSVGIWPQARIVSVRVFAGGGGGTTVAAVVAALGVCRERGAIVVNLSLSGLDSATAEELAWLSDHLRVLRDVRGMNVVAGAGNNGGAVGYPGRLHDVFAVGATDATGRFCAFSNRGDGLDISALGCAVELSWPGGGLGSGIGTSYSTPVASSVLLALRAYAPSLRAAQAEGLLLSTADSGRIDATAAFRAAGLSSLTTWLAPAPIGAQPQPGSVGFSRAPHYPDALSELGVRAPRVRQATYRGSILTVRIARVPDFARAIFRIDGRLYSRNSELLRLRLRRMPRRVSVRIEVPTVGGTEELTIRVRRERARASLRVKT